MPGTFPGSSNVTNLLFIYRFIRFCFSAVEFRAPQRTAWAWVGAMGIYPPLPLIVAPRRPPLRERYSRAEL